MIPLPLPHLAAALLGLALPTLASANTFYRCQDANGNTLYTNQKGANKNCTVLSVMAPPAPGTRAPGATPATRTPTPADFPKVAHSEQQARDSDRRTILDSEMANERSLLDKARQAGKPDAVALHERNIEALKKELAKLR